MIVYFASELPVLLWRVTGHCHHLSSSSTQVVAPDVVLNCPRASVRRPSEPAMIGQCGSVVRPQLSGLHSVIAPVRSTTGQLISLQYTEQCRCQSTVRLSYRVCCARVSFTNATSVLCVVLQIYVCMYCMYCVNPFRLQHLNKLIILFPG